MRTFFVGLTVLLVCAITGCGGAPTPANPFMTLAERSGAGASQNRPSGGSSGQQAQSTAFRASMNVTFNNNSGYELDTSFLAWVAPGGVRTAEQQEELLNSNYIQITEELRLGSAVTLGAGTYVYNGPGAAHVTPVHLEPSQAGDGTAGATLSSMTIRLVAPDGLLVFSQPPVSCGSVAFTFSQQGEPLPPVPAGYGIWNGATNTGGLKTLAQVSAYQCDPFKPGLFLYRSGGPRQSNEFLESDDITFEFRLFPDENGYCANVTIGASGS